MSSFESYILVVKQNNKSLFEAQKIKISPKSLERLLEQSFYAGYEYHKELTEMNIGSKIYNESNNPLNIFKDIFGGKNE